MIGSVLGHLVNTIAADTMQNSHQQVKSKILERMAEWAEMFSKDPDLGIMDQAYNRLKSQSLSSWLHPRWCLLTHHRS